LFPRLPIQDENYPFFWRNLMLQTQIKFTAGAFLRRQLVSGAFVVFALSTCLFSGCGPFRRMTGLAALHNGIVSKFHLENVEVSLQPQNNLTVMLAHPRYATGPDQARSAEAQQMAEFVRDNYRDIKSIDSIRIMMTTSADGSIRGDLTVRGTYLFDRNAKLKRGPAAPTPGELLLYGERANDGTVRDGMLLFPSLGIHIGKGAVPANVDLDLNAFSAGPIFKDDHRFSLVADGKTVAEGSANLQSSSTIADGQTAEFMRITITYAEFKQLASSGNATLTIGPKEIRLTDEHRAVFQKMVGEIEASAGETGRAR
jgi:hypothetical protein